VDTIGLWRDDEGESFLMDSQGCPNAEIPRRRWSVPGSTKTVVVAALLGAIYCGSAAVADTEATKTAEKARGKSSSARKPPRDRQRPSEPVADPIAIQVETARWNPECRKDYRQCRAQLPVCVRGPVAPGVHITRFRLGRSDAAQHPYTSFLNFEAPAPTEPCGQDGVRYLLPNIRDEERSLAVTAILADAAGKQTRVVSPPFVLENPKRAEAEWECLEHRGRWKRIGLAARLGCVERANDAGKPCSRGRECEGLCVFDKYEPLTPDGGATSDCPPALAGKTCLPRRRGLFEGRPVGHCSEFTSDFSCVEIIYDTTDGSTSVGRVCYD
jgi:hypothetical protein